MLRLDKVIKPWKEAASSGGAGLDDHPSFEAMEVPPCGIPRPVPQPALKGRRPGRRAELF